MSYKVLDKNLLPVGDLILENNIGATNFWGDQVTRQLAQDDSNQDPATTMSMTVNSTDAKANNKLWNHTLSLSFDNTEDVGSKVVAQDSYLLYQDEQTGRWYLMNVYQSDEYENYRTAQAQNSAIIELSKIYTTGKTFTQARLTDIVNYVFSFVPFSAQIADDSGIILDSYTIDKATSVQAIIQDLQVKYDVDVDAFVEMDNNGRINNRVISFEHVGHNNGAKIWYGSAVKGAESIQRTGISSTLYTKFYINGVAKDGDADSGSIKSVNAGKDYIVDDTANEMYNPIGASMDVPTYLEVRLENTLLSEPTALLSWGNKIVGLFNHPRFNYVVTSMHDADYGLGDTVVVNDDSKKPALVISSRVIQIITSQARPETNTITLGEFSNLFTVKNEQATTILTLKKDINIVQIAADNAVNQAKVAHDKAVKAQEQAVHAQTSADGKTMSFTVASVEDLPVKANEGDIAWVTLEDGTHGYTFINGHWIEDINPNLKKSIQDSVTTAVSQAKSHTATAIEQNNASQQEMMDDIAKSQADLAIKDADFINKAQAMADKALSDAKANIATVASKSLGTYLVRLLPGTNIFKTTNSTTIQAQVWKAGQDITSTLDSTSFSWKIAKDGNAAISLTNNVKNVTAKPSDFNSTGTYIVNVIIPVTDTTGTTRNQTFSDSTTIANLADGKNGATGNGISSTTITYAVSASGTNAPTSGYTSTIPTVNKGQFLWQRTVISYTNGTTKNSDVVTYFAKDGLKGVDGIDGGQGMIAQPSKPTSGLVDGFLWLDTSQTYPVYYIYDSSIKDFKIYQFNAKNINADQIKAKFVGTDRLSASEIIADDLHVKSANIDGRLTASQITVSSTNGAQTSLANFNLGEMSQTISDTKNEVNSLGQINQLFNTEFTPDLQGWTLDADKGSNAPYASFVSYGSRGIGFNTENADANTFARLSQTVILPSTHSSTDVMSLSWRVNTRRMDNYCHIWLVWQDANGVSLGQNTMGNWNDSTLNNYNVLKWENISIPIDAKQVDIRFETREGTNAYIFQPMVSFTDTIGTYVAGAYNNNAALAQVKITADGVSSIVSNPTTGLSTRVQTAEGTLSKVQGIDIPALQNATFWQAPNGYDLNTYLTQGSTFFRDTTARTNAPTISTKWMYLVVERTPNGDRVTQTAWYDTLTDAKITYRRQYAGTWGTWYANDNDSVTTITQTNGNVTREIENRKTGDNNTLQSSKDFTQSTITSYDSGLQSQLTQTSSAFLATISSTNLVVDSSLLDSAATNTIVNWIPSGTSKWYYSPGVSYQGVQSMGYNQTANDANYSFVDSQPWSNNSFSGTTLNVSIDIYVPSIGGSSTDYLIVYLRELDVNGNLIAQTSITNTISTSNNSWVNYRKKITVDSNSKRFFIRYQMRGNGNVYVARPYVGFQELIDGGYTAGSNNNNQTILSLFKDNWSIGITDNIGAITSGIVGNSSSMSLISKNIVLDGNTTVTGTFKVSQANIANGAIGTAQIGDASITSAKIANLDASKISGGTISGIDFNVNRRMTIASGGIIHSDVMDITKDAFNLLGMMNNTKTFVTAYNTQVSFANAVYGIDSSSGEIHSSGKITAIAQDGTKSQADFTSSYSNNHLMFSTVNSTDGSKDNFVHITNANITILSGADSADTATDYSNISPVRIRTTGDMIAGSSITSGNIQLNSYHTIISRDGLPLYVTGNGGNPVDFNVNQLTANNIVLNAAHSIISKDNGKMYFYGGNGKQVELGVKSLTQSSLVSLKENIAEVDEFDLLHKTISADLNRYNFIGDNDKYTHVTPMIDDVNGKKYIPREWVSEDGRSVDTYTIIGYLVGSVKALQKQINKLEQG
ncbi:hypothetical protein HTZ88_02090 [Leuconostoc carnosum]|uniref:hypothetical protein n=1 Tax=Leuconostoc carnosum TaxID=1252 RepID=UPI00272DD942|nr:hypothetical protein [Leuconostoc carnosum]WLC58836.1 hypothetical protein HTZ88_02090 [Leuconostoc carnosum]